MRLSLPQWPAKRLYLPSAAAFVGSTFLQKCHPGALGCPLLRIMSAGASDGRGWRCRSQLRLLAQSLAVAQNCMYSNMLAVKCRSPPCTPMTSVCLRCVQDTRLLMRSRSVQSYPWIPPGPAQNYTQALRVWSSLCQRSSSYAASCQGMLSSISHLSSGNSLTNAFHV